MDHGYLYAVIIIVRPSCSSFEFSIIYFDPGKPAESVINGRTNWQLSWDSLNKYC